MSVCSTISALICFHVSWPAAVMLHLHRWLEDTSPLRSHSQLQYFSVSLLSHHEELPGSNSWLLTVEPPAETVTTDYLHLKGNSLVAGKPTILSSSSAQINESALHSHNNEFTFYCTMCYWLTRIKAWSQRKDNKPLITILLNRWAVVTDSLSHEESRVQLRQNSAVYTVYTLLINHICPIIF